MWYVWEVLYAVLYVRVNCFVVRGCAVSRYINVCNCYMFSVVNVHHGHFNLCVVCIDGRRYGVVNVMLSLMSVMGPIPALCNLSARTVMKLCTFGMFALGVSLVSWIVMIYACVS